MGIPSARLPQFDMPILMTTNIGDNCSRIECIMPPHRDGQVNAFAMQLDGMMSGGMDGLAAITDLTAGAHTFTIYGLAEFVGISLSVLACGVYLGDFVVNAQGRIVIDSATSPINIGAGGVPDLISAWSDIYTPDGDFWEYNSCRVMRTTNGGAVANANYIPLVVGSKFNSDGQCLRVSSAQESKSQLGPTIAELRRVKHVGAQVRNLQSISMSVGGDPYASLDPETLTGSNDYVFYPGMVYPAFVTMTPVPVVYPGGQAFSNNLDNPGSGANPPVAHQNSFNGVLWTPINDQFSFDGMIAWRINDPFPGGVTAVGGFYEIQGRG